MTFKIFLSKDSHVNYHTRIYVRSLKRAVEVVHENKDSCIRLDADRRNGDYWRVLFVPNGKGGTEIVGSNNLALTDRIFKPTIY